MLRFTFLTLGLALLGCSGSATPDAKPPTESSPETQADGGAAGSSGQAKICGGIAGFACPAGQYCSFPAEAQCGAADQTGSCLPIPEACTEQYEPVCGCDDKTYGNACQAAAASVSVLKPGECAAAGQTPGAASIPEGGLCGTRGVNGECAAGLFCAFDADCGESDRGGHCKPKPQACTKIYAPVCGCDHKTYASECVAQSAGVSVTSTGECPKQP